MGKLDDMWRIEKCPICGKSFIPTFNYVYKLRDKKQRTIYYCSYTCWRKAGGDNGPARHYNRTKRKNNL